MIKYLLLLWSTPGPTYCSRCGAANPAGASYCIGCGMKLG